MSDCSIIATAGSRESARKEQELCESTFAVAFLITLVVCFRAWAGWRWGSPLADLCCDGT